MACNSTILTFSVFCGTNQAVFAYAYLHLMPNVNLLGIKQKLTFANAQYLSEIQFPRILGLTFRTMLHIIIPALLLPILISCSTYLKVIS